MTIPSLSFIAKPTIFPILTASCRWYKLLEIYPKQPRYRPNIMPQYAIQNHESMQELSAGQRTKNKEKIQVHAFHDIFVDTGNCFAF